MLRLTGVPVARHELRVTLSHGWLEFQRPDTSYGWLHATADLSPPGCIWHKADSISRLTWVPAARYELQLIPSCSCLRFAADSSSAGWTRLAAVLYFNISSKFKDLFSKMHYFYGLFSTTWFKLPLIQVLLYVSKTLKKVEKLEEAWGTFKTISGTDSSCSGVFEVRRLIRDLRPIDYLQTFDPMPPDGKESVNKGHVFGDLLTNLSKAFDCLPHNLLIGKLNA